MRIALFTETFLPRVDGVVTTLCHLLDHLALRGHESLLFAPATDVDQYANTPVVSFGGVTFPLYPEFTIAMAPPNEVRLFLDAFRPDLIHVLSPVALGLTGLWQARRHKIPVVASYHTDVPGYVAHYGFGLLESPVWAALRLIHNQADLNLCPSSVTLRELEAQGIRSAKLWTRGVDTERYHPGHQSAEWRRRLSAGEPDKPLLLFVGRLSLEKRVHWLPLLAAALPEARLAVVGDGPERQSLEEQCRDLPVVFTGYLHGHDLARAYASADVFVFPSANETLGNVVLEAMASGLAIVAADAGGPRDLVKHGHNGLLFSPDSLEAMIAAVRCLLDQPAFARRLRHNARFGAEQRTWTAVFEALLDDYADVIHTGVQERRFLPRRLGSAQSPRRIWLAR